MHTLEFTDKHPDFDTNYKRSMKMTQFNSKTDLANAMKFINKNPEIEGLTRNDVYD